MFTLPKSLATWGTPAFEATLKAELAAADIDELGLQQVLTTGNTALAGSVQAMLITADDQNGDIHARVGLFFKSIIAGCGCADDPTPVNEQNEYCEALLIINKGCTEATVCHDGGATGGCQSA